MYQRWLQLKKEKNYLLTGPQRAGKTTLLKRQFPSHKYITLDDFDYLEMAEKDPKKLPLLSPKMIIDEAQRVPKLAIAVKYALDEMKSQVHLSGSSRIGLLDSSIETLAGRITPQSLPPFCFGEELGAPTHSIFDDEINHKELKEAQRELQSFMNYGGFPEVLSHTDEKDKKDILKNYKNTYFTRDLALLSHIENVSALLGILNHYALSIGSLTQVSHFQSEVGVSHQTAKKYLNTIYQSELGFKISGYQYGSAKRQLKASKSYYCDNGLLTSLSAGHSKGQLVENFVISELEKRRKLGFYDTDQFYYYQTIGGSEIDLIIELEDSLKIIEIKASERPSSKDLKNLKNFSSSRSSRPVKAYLFHLGDYYDEREGVKLIPIAAFHRGV